MVALPKTTIEFDAKSLRAIDMLRRAVEANTRVRKQELRRLLAMDGGPTDLLEENEEDSNAL